MKNSNAKNGDEFTALTGTGKDPKTALSSAAGASRAAGDAHSSFSMPVAGPPQMNPVVFICADNTIRLWTRRQANGYSAAPGEQEGYWCKERPKGDALTGHIHLSERSTVQDLALQLDCIPTCIARAKPGAIAATWLEVEGIWSYVPRIVVGASDGTIRTWQVTWDGEFYDIERPTSNACSGRSTNKFHDGAVLTCLRASEGYIVSGGQDCGVVLGDHHNWKPLWTGREHTEGVNCIDFETNSKTFVSGGDDRLVALWDVSVGPKSVATLPKSFGVTGGSFSDGHPYLLSVAYANQTVQLWDIRRSPICLQEGIDQSSHVSNSASTDTGKYTASCFDQSTHSIICAGTHATAWQIRPKKPTFWLRFWRHKVRLILVFIRWYVRNRKKQVPTTHSAPVLLAQYTSGIDSVMTVDVHGVIRLWSADAPQDDSLVSYVAQYSVFGARTGNEERQRGRPRATTGRPVAVEGGTRANEGGAKGKAQRGAAAPIVAKIELLTCAILLPIDGPEGSCQLMTASQTGKLAVHTITLESIKSMSIKSEETKAAHLSVAFAGDEQEKSWDGVPTEPVSLSFTTGLTGSLRARPVVLVGHDGTVWLCAHQYVEDARGRSKMEKPLQLIQGAAPIESLTGIVKKEKPPEGRVPGLAEVPVVTVACAYETKSVTGGGPVVLVGCRVTNKAGEAVIKAFERNAVNRPTFTVEPFSTPQQPDPNPQQFGDYRTCIYRYEPELRHALFCVPEGTHDFTNGTHWVTPQQDSYLLRPYFLTLDSQFTVCFSFGCLTNATRLCTLRGCHRTEVDS